MLTRCILAKQKPKKTDGYVQVSRDGRLFYAHRLAYAENIGDIPEGYTIDHLRRVRNCINPAHLEAVTFADNIRRKPISNTCGHDPSTLVGRCRDCHRMHNRKSYLKKIGAIT